MSDRDRVLYDTKTRVTQTLCRVIKGDAQIDDLAIAIDDLNMRCALCGQDPAPKIYDTICADCRKVTLLGTINNLAITVLGILIAVAICLWRWL